MHSHKQWEGLGGVLKVYKRERERESAHSSLDIIYIVSAGEAETYKCRWVYSSKFGGRG